MAEVSKKIIEQKGKPNITEKEITLGGGRGRGRGGVIRPGNRGKCCVRAAVIADAFQTKK